MSELWSWALTLVGVACFWLAGRKVWWAWYVGLAGQITWAAYSLVTQQWGFLVGVVLYTVVYSKNAYAWTRDRERKTEAS
jgi:nicotinamide riboside transporter PnuC